MTIICFKNGIMAADGQSSRGGLIVSRNSKKILRMPGGELIAMCGMTDVGERFMWALRREFTGWEAGATIKMDWSNVAPDDFAAVVAMPDGRVFEVYNHGEVSDRSDEAALGLAIGAAWELARGMMLVGASAEEAVKLCCAHHAHCGGTIQVEHVGLPLSGFVDGTIMDEVERDFFDDANGVAESDNIYTAEWRRSQGLGV